MHLVDGLPRTRSAEILGRQLLRSATSVGANYRAACRGRSTAEMIAKLGIVVEEGDESLYWLELLMESNLVEKEIAQNHWREMNEIVSMTVSSINTLRRKQTQSKIE